MSPKEPRDPPIKLEEWRPVITREGVYGCKLGKDICCPQNHSSMDEAVTHCWKLNQKKPTEKHSCYQSTRGRKPK